MRPRSEGPTLATLDLAGREAEMQTVREALGAMPGLAGIVLEGEAGIGKTALWRAGIAEAETLGLRVLTASPAAAEAALSHAALGDLLAPLVDEVRKAVPGPQRQALDVVLLRVAPHEGKLEPRTVGAATLSALRAAARTSPLLLAIDDVQWLDAASATALRFALRRLRDEPVALLATRRVGVGEAPFDLGLTEEQLTRVAVGPLAKDGLQRVLQRVLGQSFPRPVLARIADVSGGNPYYAVELARAALRQAANAGLTADLPLPEGIWAVLQDRLRTLPAKTRHALGTVAAMGHPTTAAASAAVDPGVLDPAFTAGILREYDETIHFDHPLLATAAYRALPPSRRREAHERLAGTAEDAEERARHLAAASTNLDARRAADIDTGAQAAAARGAPAAAAELLEASARVEPEADVAVRRRIAAVRHHMAAGDGRRATALARALVDELPAGPLRSRALVAFTEQVGQIDELVELARQAVAEAGDDEEALIEALLAEGLLMSLADRQEEAHESLMRANALCGPSAPRTLRVRVLGAYAELAQWRGDDDAMELLREAAELEGDDLIPDAYWGPGMVLGRTLMFTDELDAARPLLEARHRRALEAGDDESRAGLSIHLAELEIREGRFAAARRYAEEGLAIEEGSYGDQAQGAVAYVRALVAAHEGDVELSRELAEWGLTQSEAQGDVIFATMNRTTLGFLELSLGNHAEAAELLWPVAQRFRASPCDPGLPHALSVPDAIEALTTLGRVKQAEELLAAWASAGERFGRPRVHATAARCRALLAASRGDLDTALAHAEAALEHHRQVQLPFERARSLIVLGTMHRRAKHKAAARTALEEALERLDAMGARLWAERARAELGRIGGRAPSGGLTPTEERVADLVATGRSNKEVADALFVSVRTVEANLTRIYAKLRIRSRTELASRRGARPPA